MLDTQPPPTRFWQGREAERAELHDWLAEPEVRLIGLKGAGGYGKSALASKLWEETQTAFAGRVWVNVSQDKNLSFAVWSREVLRLLGAVEPDISLTDEQVMNGMIRYLSAGRYLLVIDNLETLLTEESTWRDPSFERFLQRWLEQGQRSVVLLTSRENPGLLVEQARWRDLAGLAVSDGVALLTERGITGERAALEQFVQVADGHPLLLNLTVGWLKNPRKHVAPEVTYVLQQDDLVRFQDIVGLFKGDKEASVGKVLAESVARLPEADQTLWRDLSVYDRPFGVAAAQAMQPGVGADDVYGLVDRSLVQELPGQQFEFLPLIRRFAQQEQDLTAAHGKALDFYRNRCGPLERTTPPTALAEYFGVFFHACELGQYAAAWRGMQQQTVAGEDGRYSGFEMFVKFQGSGSDRLQLYEQLQRMVDRWQPETDFERNLYANTLKAIGDVLQFLKRSSEALANYEQAIGIYREVGDRLGEANTLCGLGQVQDDPAQALTYFQQAQGIYQQIGDQYSQGRNLLMFMAKAQAQLGDEEGVMRSLDEAEAIGRATGIEIFCQVAQQIRGQLMGEE